MVAKSLVNMLAALILIFDALIIDKQNMLSSRKSSKVGHHSIIWVWSRVQARLNSEGTREKRRTSDF